MRGSVNLWAEAVRLPTYPAPAPELNPMFFEQRVYQGSSGKVYPCPITDKLAERCVLTRHRAVHLENEFLYVRILPDLGGRIQVGHDKTHGYDFFYRQTVIKPALVGLLGPWVSGGVEFNWPQHHRPTTFWPVDYRLEGHADGSKTVWLSEHEPMGRTKGMVGLCLHPGRALLEAKVRLYNRTPLPQSFLWWANVAVAVHEQYQAFFPPEVGWVADHARRAVSEFPVCRGVYYGVDYRPGVDLSWYRHIPVPTSYMAVGAATDFAGGYDHRQQAGVVHVANHHIAPGKKLWTWGNAAFGRAWEGELTDSDGPYVELMAGVYTDNQPDFSWLAPFETRTFSQYWYPIHQIGPPKNATRDLAVNLEVNGGRARIGVCATARLPRLLLRLEAGTRVVVRQWVGVAPGEPCRREVKLPRGTRDTELVLRVTHPDGRELIRYRPPVRAERVQVVTPATEPPAPGATPTVEALYLTGLHLEQYRHATRSPEPYWREALRREPTDARSHNALGLWHLRRGGFGDAEAHFRQAAASLTRWNANPADGEPFYNLGLALCFLRRDEAAYGAFYKAAWNYAWQSAAYYALAELDCRRGDWARALEHLDRSLATNAGHTKALNLKAEVWARLGRRSEARRLRAAVLALDPLDAWANPAIGDVQTALDVALDLAQAGLYPEASARLTARPSRYPMVGYALGYFAQQEGDARRAQGFYRMAARQPPDYCFPARLEELVILEAALSQNPNDAKAHYYLGNLLYDKRRQPEAIRHWEDSARLEGAFAIVWRNLGLGYFNISRRPARARAAYRRACAANPRDARLRFEFDQLRKRLNESPRRRLTDLERYQDLVRQRDDLSVEFVTLLNHTGQHARALAYLESRRFHPWEGGEGQTLAQYVRARVALGQAALASDPRAAHAHFQAALEPPATLGETRHPLASASDIHFWLGEASAALGDKAGARKAWQAAAASRRDFQRMRVAPFSALTYYQALALRRLGQSARARQRLRALMAYARQLMITKATIDYFATSLPTLLLFTDDLQRRQRVTALFLLAQAHLGLGRRAQARRLFARVRRLDCGHPAEPTAALA